MSSAAPSPTIRQRLARAFIGSALLLASTVLALVAGGSEARACRYVPGLAQQVTASWRPGCAHPLCGTIHSVDPARLNRTKTSCDGDPYLALRRDSEQTLKASGFLLLGEVHDNAEQHRLRGALLGDLLRLETLKKRKPAAVFEHIRRDQKQGLDLYTEMSRNGQHMASTANLFRFLKWEQSGWPPQAMFEPLFAAVIAHKLPILPAEPARDEVRGVAQRGLASIAEPERKRLRLDEPLSPALNEALLTELEASHCGLVPKSAFASMAEAQRYRDAYQAAALVAASSKHGGAILFAGNGHVRSDRGVPHHLRLQAPKKQTLTALLVEVETGKTDPKAYVPRDPDGKPAADYLIFTPRVERKDPCIAMREQMNRKSEQPKQ